MSGDSLKRREALLELADLQEVHGGHGGRDEDAEPRDAVVEADPVGDHDVEQAADAADARRLGGLRRRKEGTIAVAYDLPGLDTVVGIRRLLDIVVTDGVGLDNGIPRLRVLISTALAAMNLLKVGELEERLAALEAVVGHHPAQRSDDPLGLP